MVVVTLPDGSKREFENAVRVADVAQSIGSGLAKAALGGIVDGKMVDLSHLIDQDAQLAIVTDKSPEALEIVRHSCLLYTSPSPRDRQKSRMPSSA